MQLILFDPFAFQMLEDQMKQKRVSGEVERCDSTRRNHTTISKVEKEGERRLHTKTSSDDNQELAIKR